MVSALNFSLRQALGAPFVRQWRENNLPVNPGFMLQGVR